MRNPLRNLAINGLVVSLGVLVACSDASVSSPDDTQPLYTTSVAPADSDGVLRLGLLLPQSGDGSQLGDPLIEIARSAVGAVNEAGGVLGRDVELVVSDEGADSATALTSVDEMIATRSIDAVIGPLSSTVALGVVPHLVELGIGTCSPAATSASLVELPDDGLFVRTSPSDDLASEAMAQLVSQTGVTRSALVFPDDPYGRAFSEAVKRALGLQGIEVSPEVAYDPTEGDFRDSVSQITADGETTVALIGDRDGGGRLLTELLGRTDAATIVVNDGLADVDLSTIIGDDPDSVARVVGVAVDAFAGLDEVAALVTGTTNEQPTTSVAGSDRTDPSIPAFSAAVVDCINLLTIAAETSGTDAATTFMNQVIAVSRVGTACRTFETCVELGRSGLNVDYNGPTGVLALNPNGDPSQSTFVTFGFDLTGRSVFRSQLGVFSAP